MESRCTSIVIVTILQVIRGKSLIKKIGYENFWIIRLKILGKSCLKQNIIKRDIGKMGKGLG